MLRMLIFRFVLLICLCRWGNTFTFSSAATRDVSKAVSFTDCGSKESKVVSLDVTPCDSDPCVFKKGVNVTVSLEFIPTEEITSAKISLYAIFGLIPIPLPLPNPNACEGYDLVCPLKPNVQDKFVLTQEIAESFPSGSFKIKAEVKDQNSNEALCFEFPVKIQ